MKLAWPSALLLPLILLPIVVTEAQTCSNGLVGYEASDVCCPVGCGKCGGSGCSKRGDGCCTSDVKDSGVKCSKSRSAPCNIDTDSVDPIDTQMCPGGIPGINAKDIVCCPLSCGSCAGKGCPSRPGGPNACCGGGVLATHGLCSDTGEAPCVLAQAQPTCSNGLPGYEASDVCCPVGCGKCGGSGCSKRGDGCCTGDVKGSRVKCSESRSAPCNIDTDSVNPVVSADCSTKWDSAGSDVVLLMGQSNMAGRGMGYDAAIDGPNDSRIQQWTRGNTIITASERLQHADWDSLPQFDTRVGMGTAFGRAYVQNLPPQRNVLLVPTAHGSSGLVDGPWSPGGDLFEDAVSRMEAALDSNDAKGNCVAAILWHQGEKDADASVDQDTYESSWKDMMSELRSRIPAAAEAPVILGEFTAHQMKKYPDTFEPILAAIRAIPDAVPMTAVASSDGLESNPNDDLHFNAAAMREYGQRYFNKLVEAVENER